MSLYSCSNFSEKREQIKVYKSVKNQSNLKNLSYGNKVAAILPISGKNSKLGSDILNSCLLAVEKYNDVEMLILDSNLISSNPDNLVKILNKNNIKYVIGPVFGNDALKIKNLVPGIVCFSLSNNLKLSGINTIICGITPQNNVKALFKYAVNSDTKKILALLPKTEYGNSVNEIIDSLDTKNTYIRKVRYFKNLNKIIEDQLRDTDFDAVFLCEFNQNLPLLEDGFYMIACDFWKDEFSGVNRFLIASPEVENLSKFQNYFKKYFDKEPSILALIGYDVANVVFSISTDPDEFSDSKKYHGVLGDFSIKDGKIKRKWFVYEK